MHVLLLSSLSPLWDVVRSGLIEFFIPSHTQVLYLKCNFYKLSIFQASFFLLFFFFFFPGSLFHTFIYAGPLLCCPIWLFIFKCRQPSDWAMGSAIVPFYKLTSLMWFVHLIFQSDKWYKNFHYKFVHKNH